LARRHADHLQPPKRGPERQLATLVTSPESGFLPLTLAAFIALAGVIGNVGLLPVLRDWTWRKSLPRNVLPAWLAGNLFLGSRICWMLRPFIRDPTGRMAFIGSEYLHGSFFETVWAAARLLLFLVNSLAANRSKQN
jgi:hypothetical protein